MKLPKWKADRYADFLTRVSTQSFVTLNDLQKASGFLVTVSAATPAILSLAAAVYAVSSLELRTSNKNLRSVSAGLKTALIQAVVLIKSDDRVPAIPIHFLPDPDATDCEKWMSDASLTKAKDGRLVLSASWGLWRDSLDSKGLVTLFLCVLV